MRKVGLLSAASTKYGKMPYTARDLALLAAKEAIESANINPNVIQGAFVANAFGISEKQGHLGPLIMSGLGIPDIPATSIESACCSGGSAFREAYVNILSGMYDVMLVIGTEKISHLDTLTATTYFSYGGDYLFEGNCGASFPGLYATMARAHMEQYRTTEEDLANIAVKNHINGLLNDKAHLQKKISVQDVLDSAMVAHPLKLYDSCPFSDGAAAVVLASDDWIKKNNLNSPVFVKGSGRAGGAGSLHSRSDLTSLRSTKLAIKSALKQANLKITDIDLAEVHDCFTIAELIAIEDLGFFETGKAAQAISEDRTKINSDIPINSSGGLKSKGHPVGTTGVGQIVEIFDQLTDNAGQRQNKNSEIGLTHNVGATGGSCAVHIFERE